MQHKEWVLPVSQHRVEKLSIWLARFSHHKSFSLKPEASSTTSLMLNNLQLVSRLHMWKYITGGTGNVTVTENETYELWWRINSYPIKPWTSLHLTLWEQFVVPSTKISFVSLDCSSRACHKLGQKEINFCHLQDHPFHSKRLPLRKFLSQPFTVFRKIHSFVSTSQQEDLDKVQIWCFCLLKNTQLCNRLLLEIVSHIDPVYNFVQWHENTDLVTRKTWDLGMFPRAGHLEALSTSGAVFVPQRESPNRQWHRQRRVVRLVQSSRRGKKANTMRMRTESLCLLWLTVSSCGTLCTMLEGKDRLKKEIFKGFICRGIHVTLWSFAWGLSKDTIISPALRASSGWAKCRSAGVQTANYSNGDVLRGILGKKFLQL